MFLERPKKDVTALIPYLKQKGIAYEISDSTLPGEEVNMAHVEFLRELSPEEIEHINNMLDNLYEKDTTARIQTKDTDGNGRADIIDAEIEEQDERAKEKPVRKEWTRKCIPPYRKQRVGLQERTKDNANQR